jgi:thioredoxin 1
MSETITVTDSTFDAEVLASAVPVLVDFWAEWCAPCKMIAPMLAETASSYAGRVTIAKVNIDDNPGTPSRYHVRSIPTLMLFANGQPVATHVGALSKSQLAALLDGKLDDTVGRGSPRAAAR